MGVDHPDVTDKELLDGLQRLFDQHVVALRSCRSGVKVDVAQASMSWLPPDKTIATGWHRDYFGSDANGSEYGGDIRAAIARAITGELVP